MTHYLSRIEDVFKRNWEKPALGNYKGEVFKYKEIAASIEKFHIFFEAIGIRKGQRIAIYAKNSARWATSFLAVNSYEAVVVPLLSDFTTDSVCHLINHSESVILFTDKDMWTNFDIKEIPGIRAVISVNDFTLLYSRDEKVKNAFDGISEAFNTKYPLGFNRESLSFPTQNLKETSVINYTSGTTSAPKGVILRYECFSAMVDFATSRVFCNEEDSIVSMLPMGHIYGLVFEFLFPICFGVKIFYFGKTPSPTLLLKAMEDVKPYMVVTVPLVMEKIYRSAIKPRISKWYMKALLSIPGISHAIYSKIGRKLMDSFGGKVRYFIMGGAALNPEAEKVFKKIKLPYTVGYGMTEAAPLLTYEDWRHYVPGSCGKQVECTEIRIDSEDPQHIAGEIQARGTNICSGYLNNPEASANAFTDDGFLRTGDLGIMDKDGNIFIKGRSKNMILSANGQNIYPEELEAVLNSQDYVAESVVVDRNGKLVGLVFFDEAAIKKDKLDAETISDIPENIKNNSNRVLPAYSKLSKVEIVLEPFEKTPKMSIKRFLYK